MTNANLTLNRPSTQAHSDEEKNVNSNSQTNEIENTTTEATDKEKAAAAVMSKDDQMTSRVNKFLAVMDSDGDLAEVFQITSDANRVQRTGTFLWFLRLVHDFPLNSDLAKELPEPDTSTGNNPDKYKKHNEPRKQYSFYGDLFDRWHVGSAIKFQIEQAELALDDKTRGAAEEKWRLMATNDPEKLEKHLKNLRAKQSYGRGKLKQAAACIFQLQRFKELEPAIIVQYNEELNIDEDVLSMTPFTVRDGTTIETKVSGETVKMLKNPGAYTLCSVDGFLSINTKYVIDNGGAYAQIADAMKPANRVKIGKQGEAPRKPQPEGHETETDKEASEIEVTLETLPSVADRVSEQLRKVHGDKKARAGFLRFLMTTDGEDTLLSLGHLRIELNAWFDQYAEIDAKYKKLDEEETDKTGFDTERKAS